MSGTVVSHIGAKIWVLFMRVGDTREAFEALWLTEQLESEINWPRLSNYCTGGHHLLVVNKGQGSVAWISTYNTCRYYEKYWKWFKSSI